MAQDTRHHHIYSAWESEAALELRKTRLENRPLGVKQQARQTQEAKILRDEYDLEDETLTTVGTTSIHNKEPGA